MKSNVVFIFIVLSVLLSSFGQVLLKMGMSGAQIVGASDSFLSTCGIFIRRILNPYVLSGLFLYFSSAVVWLVVLSQVDLSLAYPFVGLGFIMTMLLSYFFFGEMLSLTKIAGTLLIVSGLFFISRGF